jgi:DNA repair protein RadC
MNKYTNHTVTATDIKELPTEQRPREKLQRKGAETLSDVELLAILIGTGTTKRPAFVLAQHILDLLDRNSGGSEVLIEDLTAIEGMGVAKATLISAALELGRRRLPSKRKQIIFPGDVYPLIRHYGNRPQEYFLSVSLNGAHEVIAVQVVSIGLVNHTLVHPREVFADPLRQRATAVIVAHNHPSGILIPSTDDIRVTQRLIQAGELMGIRILDHLIFSDESFRSMLEENELT